MTLLYIYIMEKQVVPLAKEDFDYIQQIYKPKLRDNLLTVALILLIALPFAPLYSHKGISNPLLQSMSYGYSLLLCFFLFLGIFILTYYLAQTSLKKDLRSGTKVRVTAELQRKDWIGEKKFKLFFGREILDKLEITMSKQDFYKCFKGDIIEIEYLAYSKHVLNFKVVKKIT